MVRILSGIFPLFLLKIFPFSPIFSFFLTPFSSTFFLSFFTLVVFRGGRITNYDMEIMRACGAFWWGEVLDGRA